MDCDWDMDWDMDYGGVDADYDHGDGHLWAVVDIAHLWANMGQVRRITRAGSKSRRSGAL